MPDDGRAYAIYVSPPHKAPVTVLESKPWPEEWEDTGLGWDMPTPDGITELVLLVKRDS
jgi:hypothetical protein